MFSNLKYYVAAVSICAVISGCSLDTLSKNQIGYYTGKIPCSDCPGIVVSLDLREKAVYESEQMYMERKKTVKEKGTWRIIKEKDVLGKMQNTLELTPYESSAKTLYILVNNTTLQLLDTYKMQIETATLKKHVN